MSSRLTSLLKEELTGLDQQLDDLLDKREAVLKVLAVQPPLTHSEDNPAPRPRLFLVKR